MHSTDHNINNPTSVDLISLQRTVESWQYPTVKNVRQEEYDLMQSHDPFTYFVIIDAQTGPMQRPKIYMGDHLLPLQVDQVNYLLGIDDHNNYDIYMNTIAYGTNHLVPICTYHDPQQAIKNLHFFNNVGSHSDQATKTYNTLLSYINRNISLNDTLIGILIAFGFKDSVELQEVVQTGITYGCRKLEIDIPVAYRDMLPVIREHAKNPLMKKYVNLYDLMVKWDFFKDEKFKDAESGINLSNEIHEIMRVMTEYVGM